MTAHEALRHQGCSIAILQYSNPIVILELPLPANIENQDGFSALCLWVLLQTAVFCGARWHTDDIQIQW